VTRRRRALLLAGLALVLGGLAASDVSSRESALDRRIGPAVGVVVARAEIPAGTRLQPGRLAIRTVPARYAPPGAVHDPAALTGLRVAVDVPAGQEIVPALVESTRGKAAAPGPSVQSGERVADVVAAGSPELVQPGGRVDVLVTRDDRPGAPGRTVLALEDVEVLAASAAPTAGGSGDTAGTPRVAASLRVTLRQAVYLAAAQSFARELRLLPRAPGDRRRGRVGLAADAALPVP
jgi:pilus assembly protein CpaB